MAWHHPSREEWPRWVIDLGNNYFHKAMTIVQRMKATPENMAIIRGFIDALEYEYLRKRCVLDQVEGIGEDSKAVKDALDDFR